MVENLVKGNKMGRKSIAQKILERYETKDVKDPRPGLNKLVTYDFEGQRIAKEFFQNLKRLLRKIEGFRLQYSVLITKNMMGAKAIKELAQYYDCKDVRIFATEELE